MQPLRRSRRPGRTSTILNTLPCSMTSLKHRNCAFGTETPTMLGAEQRAHDRTDHESAGVGGIPRTREATTATTLRRVDVIPMLDFVREVG